MWHQSEEETGSLASSPQWLQLSLGLWGLALSYQMLLCIWGLTRDTSVQSKP